MIAILTIYGIIALLVAIALFLCSARAPIGYEDEDGFHFGPEPKADMEAGLAETLDPAPRRRRVTHFDRPKISRSVLPVSVPRPRFKQRTPSPAQILCQPHHSRNVNVHPA